MALSLRVTVSPERAKATPGETLTFEITVRNASDIVEHYAVDVLGLPDGATALAEPDVAKLRPGETADLTVRLTFPETPPAPAGTYVLGVLAKSKYRDDVSRCVELPLELAVVGGLTVQAAPEIAMGGASGSFTVDVANSGNTVLQLRLTAHDPERRVGAVFAPATLESAPGTRVQSLLTVQAPVPWSKEKTQKLTIEAAASDPNGGTPAVIGTGSATFVQKPRFASKLARIVGIAVAVLLVAAAIATPAIISLVKDDKPVVQPSAAPAAPPSGPAPAGPSSAPAAPPAGGASSGPAVPPAGGGASGGPAGQPLPPRSVNLAAPGGVPASGVLASDAFRNEGFLVSADPGSGASVGCTQARAVAVIDDGAGGRVLTSAHPDDPTRCHDVPLMIDFLPDGPAGTVAVQPLTPGTMRMEVAWRDLSRTIETDLTAGPDPKRGGIDFVVLRNATATATSPVAVRSITFTPQG